ncbi:4-coumarate--CoA ligase 1 [Fopius arisanus]|uniref:4-coumarate--CoA ligase 1 n=1 Tax=Fopius arisanus TaxID=64838 RepID=A0A0C9QD54_9HYME|nr:PREDICTED: 4-coumarate--CoA ligase 1-like [Fopius arisanus]
MSEKKVQDDFKYDSGVWTGCIDPPGDSRRTLGRILLSCMRNRPEHVGQIDGDTGEEDTYASMSDRAVRCALWFNKQNLKSRDCIAICTDNHLNTVVPVLAAIFTGIIFHPWWDMNLDQDTVRHFLKLGEPKVVFIDEEISEVVEKVIDDLGMETKIVTFQDAPRGNSLQAILKEQELEEVERFDCTDIEDANQPGIFMCTSGSTGYPKCVVQSYNWLEKCLDIFPEESTSDNTILWFSKISWTAAVAGNLGAIRHSATVILNKSGTVNAACAITEKYKIKCMVMTTAIASELFRREERSHDLSSVKYVIYGGSTVTENLDSSLRTLFPNACLVLAYGATEVGICLRRRESSKKFGSSGRVQKNFQIKVVDPETGRTCGKNERGEIRVRAPNVMFHYHKDPESTQKVVDSDGWYCSGDFGYYDADGDFFIIDRLGDVIKYKIILPVVPSVVENVILKYPGVSDAAVVAKPDALDVEQPMAFVTINAGYNVTETAIIKFVEDHLPDHMKLRGGVKILEKMPRVHSGKISRKCLREMAKAFAEL